MRQSKTLILSTNVDKKIVSGRVLDCNFSPDYGSRKHCFLRFLIGVHARIQGGSNFDNFFLVDEGRREDLNTTISRPPTTRQRNGTWPNIKCWLCTFVAL